MKYETVKLRKEIEEKILKLMLEAALVQIEAVGITSLQLGYL